MSSLRNQLRLVGKGSLLPDDIEDGDGERARRYMRKFMVRRLNTLNIGGKLHTRNMYRREWRTGVKAEVKHTSDEQKLVTALVQKKIGEMLMRKGDGPSFQTGLLASFESYADSARTDRVEFDGDPTEKLGVDAEDRGIIGRIADGYKRAGLGTTLPHPKMDAVTKQAAKAMLNGARKQLIFVRRVKSVRELKDKLDEHYNDWLIGYTRNRLADKPKALDLMEALIAGYREVSRRKDVDISGGEFRPGETGDPDDQQIPKNDTLFSWLFRG